MPVKCLPKLLKDIDFSIDRLNWLWWVHNRDYEAPVLLDGNVPKTPSAETVIAELFVVRLQTQFDRFRGCHPGAMSRSWWGRKEPAFSHYRHGADRQHWGSSEKSADRWWFEYQAHLTGNLAFTINWRQPAVSLKQFCWGKGVLSRIVYDSGNCIPAPIWNNRKPNAGDLPSRICNNDQFGFLFWGALTAWEGRFVNNCTTSSNSTIASW